MIFDWGGVPEVVQDPWRVAMKTYIEALVVSPLELIEYIEEGTVVADILTGGTASATIRQSGTVSAAVGQSANVNAPL